MSCLPLQLTLRGKSTIQSYRTPIYFVNLTLREDVTLKDAVQDAQSIDAELSHHGFDQEALEVTAKRGYGNSIFEMNDAEALEVIEVIEEFYPNEHKDDHLKLHQSHPEATSYAINSIEQGLRQSVTAVS